MRLGPTPSKKAQKTSPANTSTPPIEDLVFGTPNQMDLGASGPSIPPAQAEDTPSQPHGNTKPKRILLLASPSLSSLERKELRNLGVAMAQFQSNVILFSQCAPFREGVEVGGGRLEDEEPILHLLDAIISYRIKSHATRGPEQVVIKDYTSLTRFTDVALVELYRAGKMT